MTPQLQTQPQIIETDDALSRLVADLQSSDAVAIDTEADSFFVYREKICLVQVSTRERDFLIDPLKPLDITPLGEVLANPRVLKVFHAGENDIILLRQFHEFQFRNLFDTLVAAQVIGIKRYSLQAMLRDRFDVEIDKELQRSNWGRRPLTDEQIRYAALDTHFLLSLRDSLHAELRSLGRMDEAVSEFSLLESRSAERREFDPDECVKIRGARDLSPGGLRILRDIYVLRDRLASSSDVPPFRILSDATLITLARRAPRDESALRGIPGFGAWALREFGNDLLRAIADARAKGSLHIPQPSRNKGRPVVDPRRAELFDHLRGWRSGVAAERGVEPFRVAKNELLSAIVRDWPTTRDELAKVPGMEPWRLATYGDRLLDAIRRFDGRPSP